MAKPDFQQRSCVPWQTFTSEKRGHGRNMLTVGRLVCHSERYKLCLRAFVATTETNLYLSYGSKVPDTTLCESGAVRVLGLGCGAGEFDSIMFKKLLQRHSSVYNRVVEGSGEMIEKYKALVQEDRSFSAVECDWRQQTMEEYFHGQTKEDTKFHLVHAAHVLYHVDDLHDTLRNMWEQLTDDGYMLVIMETDTNDVWKLRETFFEEFGQGDRLKTSYRTSSDVKQWLDTRGISYNISEYEINIKVAECFKEGSEAGMMILDFLTQTPHVASDPEMRTKALEFIRHNSFEVEGTVLLKQIGEVIFASKKSAKM
ncbi:HNMT [Branchiostoma lanceolatum]|uniref:HNMT protein n=1 Tax=Branchiostoma lanceolatum TaxID=7740 RepID=A0A8K0ERH2_BRALA|nr:HNMT [Branchiostoma lanceolatum]